MIVMCGCGSLSPDEPARVSVRFRACVPVKSGTETSVDRLDLLVFRAVDGVIDTYASGIGPGAIEADVTAGYSLNWHLVANAPEGVFSGITREEDFLLQNTLLSYNTVAAPVMHASGNKTFSSGEPTISAGLQRYVSKVSIGKVKVSWLEEFAQAPECILETVALLNARGQICWEGTPSASATGIWYNRSGIEVIQDASAPLLVQDPNLVMGTSPVETGTELYAMPNPSENEQMRTRLVLGLRVDGFLQWYPIILPAMRCNTHYRVENLFITGPGAPEPDGVIDRSSIGFNLEIRPWGSNTSDVEFATN